MQKKMKSIISLLLVLAFAMSMTSAFAAPVAQSGSAATFVSNATDDADMISLAEVKEFTVTIPLEDAVASVLDPDAVVWNLNRDTTKEYIDPEKFPNQKMDGELTSWKTSKNAQMFTILDSKVEDGNLVMTFENACYWGTDPSVPHTTGGPYMDVCGYFNLEASVGNDVLGSVAVKIVPYDSFRTMDEIYGELDAMEIFGTQKTDLYVEQFSMGLSSGDLYEAMDMPYLIIADSEETVQKWLAYTEKAETDPETVLEELEAGVYNDLKVPVMFSNIHSNEVAASDGILDFMWMILESAATGDAMEYDVLTDFTAQGETQLATEMANSGVVVPDLVKDTATYLGFLKAGNRNSGVVDLNTYYTIETKGVTTEELLEDVFFILVPEENVEGREFLTRQNSAGYDLNRDNSFQTTEETQNMQKLIATFNPVSLMEFHGRVKGFQVEPCSPPHEPNFEYDLLSKHMVGAGEAFGIAAVANNAGYNSYTMPMRDYLYDNGDGTASWSPWDDMSTSYTPQFAMLQGTLAYTVELPAYSDDTVDAVQYGSLGNSQYIAENKISILESQAEIFQRGVTNFNSDAYELVGQWLADQNDEEGAEMDLFRPEFDGAGENGNFYPEFYIIPLDGVNQKNLEAAFDMMVWLSRNDVKILVTEADYTYDGVTYPAGTMIVSMYQAKRSVANGALYKGTLITGWTELYSEGITSFNETRGFDMVTVAKVGEIDKVLAVCGDPMDYDDCTAYVAEVEGSYFTGVKNADVIISNASEASTSAVNELLNNGKVVGMVTDKNSEFYDDFICSYEDYLTVADKYTLSATGVVSTQENYPAALVITKAPKIFITGAPTLKTSGFVQNGWVSGAANWNYDRAAMELMNFTTVENVADADIVIGASALSGDALTAVKNGTPYIGYGSSATSDRTVGAFLTGTTRVGIGSGAMDLKPYVEYPTTNLINGSYVVDEDDVMYGYGCAYFSAVPDGAEVLVQVDDSKLPTEGFMPTNSGNQAKVDGMLDGGIWGFSYSDEKITVALFANSLTHKVHQRDEYAYISNFIFSNLLGDEYVPTEVPADEEIENVETGDLNLTMVVTMLTLSTVAGAAVVTMKKKEN